MTAAPPDASPLAVRRLSQGEWPATLPLLRQLRTALGPDAEVLTQLARQAGAHGYELYGAFRSGTLLALAGCRPVETLARGCTLHLDDLVVEGAARGTGVGRVLLTELEAEARRRGLGGLFLEARPAALGFYERLGYAPHPSPLLAKRWVVC